MGPQKNMADNKLFSISSSGRLFSTLEWCDVGTIYTYTNIASIYDEFVFRLPTKILPYLNEKNNTIRQFNLN